MLIYRKISYNYFVPAQFLIFSRIWEPEKCELFFSGHIFNFLRNLGTLGWSETPFEALLKLMTHDCLTTTTASSKSTIHDYVRPRLHNSRLPHAHDHDCSEQVHDSRPRLVSDLNNCPRYIYISDKIRKHPNTHIQEKSRI